MRFLRGMLILGFLLGAILFAPAAGTDLLLDELVRSRRDGYVFDHANVIHSADWDYLTRLLGELERKTSAEVKVVTLKSLDGGEIDDFANRLFERWGVGKKGKDNGILFIAAIDDRKTRIEVGYGLEPVIPDAAAGRILDQYVIPAFKSGDYSGGLRAGTEAIASAISLGEGQRLTGMAPLAAPAQPAAPKSSCGQGIVRVLFFVLFLYLLIRHPWILLMILTNSGGGSSRGGFGGGGFGGFGGGMSGGGGASRGW